MTMRTRRRRLAHHWGRAARAAFMSVEFPFAEQRFFKLINRRVFPARFGELEFGKPVASTVIGELRVSTVFLGIAQFDFRVFLGEPEQAAPVDPILFETMVFGRDGAPNEVRERYRTYQEAETGHAEVCAWLRGQLTESTRTLQ